MNEFIIYSILISLLYVYSGIGLAFLLCPKNLEKYSLYLSPFVGLSYFSYAGWLFANYGTGGTDNYANYLLIPPFIFSGIALIIKKKRIGELFWPFKKENILLIVISVIIFIAISSPYLLRLNGLNTVTLGNNDIANYAAVSKFLTKSSISQYQTDIDGKIRYLIEKDNFGAFISTAIPSSIFSIEPYKFQNIVIYLYYIFSLPIVFLVGFEIFRYNKFMAMIISLLCGINFHLIYINFQGYLGQVIGNGLFLSLFFIIFYAILNCNSLSCYLRYLPMMIALFFSILITYPTLTPLFFIPLFMYLLLAFIFSRSISNLFNPLIILLLVIFFTFLMSPTSFINRLNAISMYTNAIRGWDQPILSPEWIFGIVENNTTIWTQDIPILLRIIISIPVILMLIASFIHLFKKNRQIFYLSISYISFVFILYIYFVIKEIGSSSFTGEGYKAYKLITYFIPIILLSGLSYFREFNFDFNINLKKNQIICLFFIFVLITANISSASGMIKWQYDNFIDIKDNIIDLKKIDKMDRVISINIVEPSWWDQMWMYYFLFTEKKLYLKYDTYYPSSSLDGDWTLLKSGSNLFKMNISFPSGILNHQEPIITTGKSGAGDFIFINYISDGNITFKFDHWGFGGFETPPIPVQNNRFYPLEVVMDRDSNLVIINFNGKWMRYTSLLHSTTYKEITVGENRIGGTGPEQRFSGEIQDMKLESIFFDGIISITDIESDIIEINRDYYLVKKNLFATLSKGWYGIESNRYAKSAKLIWTGKNNETPTIELDVRKQNISIDMILNYMPLDANNNFSVFLDEYKIKDCKDNRSCLLNDIIISKGKHEIAFKSKLPPRSNGIKNPRILGYAFSDIEIKIRSVET